MTARATAQSNATTIRDETAPGANTATRVGGALKQLADNAAFSEDFVFGALAGLYAQGNDERFSIRCHTATVSALPAYTYANGTAGVGATITYNANGAVAAIDGYTPVLNDRLLMSFGVNAFENGVYELTQVGDAGTPAIWTRSTQADTSAKLIGSRVAVTNSIQSRGTYQLATTATITIGTDAIFYVRTGGDALPLEKVVLVDEDFLTAGLPASGVGFGRSGIIHASSGTSAVCSIVSSVNNATRIGVLQLACGTTTTGRSALSGNAGTSAAEGGGILLATNTAFFGQFKIQAAKLSDGTDTYQIFVGLADSITAIPSANCSGFIYTQASDTHWRAINSNASTTSITNSAATVVAGSDDVLTAIKDAGSDTMRFYASQTLFASISTNLPKTNPVRFICAVLKSAGTTAGSNAQIDSAYAYIYQPARRAA